jgi:hypothetical protein
MDVSSDQDRGEPMSSEDGEECNSALPVSDSNEQQHPIQQLQEMDLTSDRQGGEMSISFPPRGHYQNATGTTLVSTSRPTRESVLQRLSEALLRHSLTKVNNKYR